MTPAIGRSQKESAFSLGNAMSGAPSMSGTTKLAMPANAGMMKRKIIRVAWTETSPLNVCESTNWRPGCASSARKIIAMSPPIVKKTNVVTRYWIPITL